MNYYKEIKTELLNNEITQRVKDYSKNRSDLNTYYNVGKLLFKAGNTYGESVIKDYSMRLINELGKGYSQRNLRNMRQFYKVSKKWQTLSAKLSWSHFCEILWFDDNKCLYYIKIIEAQYLSVRQLRDRIKNNEYERLDEVTKDKLINNHKHNVIDFVKNPILIKNNNNYQNISEKILKQLILEELPSFMRELGNGFCFIDYEYKIKIGDQYNYIDLLLYNIKFKCYIVIELKITELKKSHIGQISTYMHFIDKNLKTIEENKTIGIIISKKNNKFIMEYCSDKRILSKEYIVI